MRSWDTRGKGDKPINELVKVHGKQAVNCISWNRRNEWILATAGDDGVCWIHEIGNEKVASRLIFRIFLFTICERCAFHRCWNSIRPAQSRRCNGARSAIRFSRVAVRTEELCFGIWGITRLSVGVEYWVIFVIFFVKSVCRSIAVSFVILINS